MNVQNYHEVVEALQPFLARYLKEQGILEQDKKNFKCMSPIHNDSEPSMGIAGSGKVAHCFGCGVAMNIFQACSILEKRPASGKEFNSENLKHLADKYGVPVVEGAPMTEEQVYELDTYKAYRAAAELVNNGKKNGVFSKAIGERGWTDEICVDFGVGCIADFELFKKQLRHLGFAATFLSDIDLTRKTIFGEDRLVFTIRDEKGTPVGFSSRNLSYTDDKQNGAKYVNQRSTGAKCNIYQKSTRLYGFDRVLQRASKKPKPVYIFEGFADVITAAAHGLDNCVALGGTSLTAEQLSLMKCHGYYSIILCLDGDEPGQTRLAALLDSTLSGHKDLNIQIMIIPGGADPDQFIREQSVDKFKKLKKWSAFEWRLSQFDDDTTPEEICASMIPLIVNESNYVRQEKMCETLAKETGITQKTLQNELARQQDLVAAEQSRERATVINQLVHSCQRQPSEAEAHLHTAENALFELARKYLSDSFSETSCLASVMELKKTEEEKDGSFSGFALGPDLQQLQDALCGQWRKNVWFCIGGKPNSGKTSLMCKLIFEIANHPENNACVIYHTIDDTLEQVLPKFVCVADGSHHLSLNEVMDPNYAKTNISDEMLQGLLFDRRETGYTQVQNLIKDGRLVIKDANDGNTLGFADRLIRYYKQKYPNRNIVYVIDNFHKYTDAGSAKGDERVRFKDLSKGTKNLATKHHCLVISTVEYRKTQLNAKAGNQDIAESIQIEYDANLVAHVHNELHEKKTKAVHLHRDTLDGEERILPRVEFEIGKNKITAFKESIWLDFWPSSSDFQCVSPEKVISDAHREKNAVDESSSDKKKDYFEFVDEAIDKGWKSSAPNAKYKDLHDEWPDDRWKREGEKMMKAAGLEFKKS